MSAKRNAPIELTLENVRSFSGKHVIPIRPLTLLVGENSSGKSTILAAVSTASDAAYFPFRPRFNEPPYGLGSFDTIASFKGTASAPFFSIGFVNRDRQLE